MRRLIRTVVVAVIGGLWVLGTPGAQAEEVTPPTVLVLDASGSMLATDVGGGTRMDAAKAAVAGYLDRSSGTTPGLVVYGTGTGSSDEEQEAGCRDVTTLARPGERGVADLKSRVADIAASGYTPIGASLRQANSLLPSEGDRAIILVSDGIDTCAPPSPCDVARELKAAGTDLVVHTIGFQVDEQARAELQCIAEATGGSYADASDAGSLENTITRASTRVAEAYQFPDQHITGVWASTDEFVSGTSLTPEQIASFPVVKPGTFDEPTRVHMTLPVLANKTGNGDTRVAYVRVPLASGTRLQVGATMVPPVQSGVTMDSMLSFRIQQETLEAKSCTPVASSDADVLSFDTPASAFIAGPVVGGDCPAGESLVRISVVGNEMSRRDTEFDLTVAAVPEPTELGDPINHTRPQARSPEAVVAPQTGVDAQVTPGRSPDQASVLAGTTTRGIVVGETQYYAVDLDWGQHLDGALTIVEDSDSGSSLDLRFMEVRLLGPVNQPVEMVTSAEHIDIEQGNAATFGTARPVSFANTTGEQPEGSWAAGRYVVQVSARKPVGQNTDATTEFEPITYRLDLAASGSAVQGPEFADAVGGTPSASPSGWPTASSSAPVEPTDGDGGLPVLGIAAGGAVVLVGATAVAFVARRNRARR